MTLQQNHMEGRIRQTQQARVWGYTVQGIEYRGNKKYQQDGSWWDRTAHPASKDIGSIVYICYRGMAGQAPPVRGQDRSRPSKEARYRTDQARCHFSETSQGGADTAKASLLIIIVHLITYSDLQTFRPSDLQTYGLLQERDVSFQLPGK